MLLKENSVRVIQVGVYGLWMKAYDANAPNRRHPTIRPCCVASGLPVIWLKCSEGYDVMTCNQTLVELGSIEKLTRTEAMMPKSYPNVTDPRAAKRPQSHVYTWVTKNTMK